jgi:hypothetical protein
MSKLVPSLLVLLCACQPSVTSPEAIEILELSPREQRADEPATLSVRLNLDPHFHVDYGKQSARMIEEPVLVIGKQTVVPLDTYLGHGQFQGNVGPGLGVGLHDIRVKLGDGREATLPEAYEVRPPGEPEPVAGYWFDTIQDQTVNERFTVTIHAEGDNAPRFDGKVLVKLYRDGVPTGFSVQTRRFSQGHGFQELTIDTPGDNYLVVVQDAQNKTATSNAFGVHSKN